MTFRFWRRQKSASASTAMADDTALAAADALLDARNFDAARVNLDRLVGACPLDPAVHYRLGILHTDMNDAHAAVASFDRVIAMDPRHFRAHNNRGSCLQVLGRMAEAEAAFRHAIALAPDSDVPKINLAKLCEFTGRMGEAIEIYREGVRSGADRPVFAHNLAALEGRSVDRAPDGWVVSTFDAFAPAFDRQLQSLGYDVPQRLATMLRQAGGAGVGRTLDLGCGTGLVGVALAGTPGLELFGVDLSARMLEQARARGVYGALECAEVHAWLRESPAAAFDSVVAADVFIYIGDLRALFDEVARVLRANGHLAFSTEEVPGGSFQLRATGRYAQSEAYIAGLAIDNFHIVLADPAVIRQEQGKPVAGRLWLLRRR